VQRKARELIGRVVDASTSNTPFSVATGEGYDATIAEYFDARNDVSTVAGVLTNTLYIDTRDWAGKNRYGALGTSLHEVLHFLGVGHAKLGNVLFGGETPNTNLYSEELARRCFF
jgi:hypothetical protein